MDPSYSVLIQTTSQDKCATSEKDDKDDVTKTALIAVFTILGGLVILAIAAYLIIPRVRLRRKIRKARNAENSKNSGVELSGQKRGWKLWKKRGNGGLEEVPSSPPPVSIERANDMEVNTVAGNFVVRM